MQRINLIDRSRPAHRPSLPPWLAGAASGSVVLLLATLFVAHAGARAEATLRAAEDLRQQSAIASITARIDDHPAVRAELADLQRHAAVVDDLQHRRVDASTRLLEMSRILTRGGGPTTRALRADAVGAAPRFSRSWDPHRLWLTAMQEQDDQLVIRGEGLSVDDVGELLERLQASVYFRDVRLEHTERAAAERDAPPVQRFTLVARL